jgi:hypothetical protein
VYLSQFDRACTRDAQSALFVNFLALAHREAPTRMEDCSDRTCFSLVLTIPPNCEKLRHLRAIGPWVNHVGFTSLLIEAAEQGDRSAAEALFGALYSELGRVARRRVGTTR